MQTTNRTIRKIRKSVKISRPFNALATARRLGKAIGRVIIVHPEKSGYGFKVVWDMIDGYDENQKQIVVASNPKIYKTKMACVTAIKKLSDVFCLGYFDRVDVYDTRGNRIDIKIKMESKRIWD